MKYEAEGAVNQVTVCEDPLETGQYSPDVLPRSTVVQRHAHLENIQENPKRFRGRHKSHHLYTVVHESK